jgi:glyoxylase-like metal-dependent hydrolase (beta-lactamase superfamily II)
MKGPLTLIPVFIFAVCPSLAGKQTGFELIMPDIYRLENACNVYLLRSGPRGILIDAGADGLDRELEKIGVKRIDWILHTHYHRDQCLGSAELRSTGAKIAIGKHEEGYLQPAAGKGPVNTEDRFLLSEGLTDFGRRMEPFQKPGVDRVLEEGDTIRWDRFAIRVIDTPGHTKGSVSYLVASDGRLICFSGDLVMRGGHSHDLYSMQWTYLQNPGIDSSIQSVDKILRLEPEIMLPSHGPCIMEPRADLQRLRSRLTAFINSFEFHRAGRWNWSGFVQVSEHVVQDCGTTSQLVISGSGKALLFDCGEGFSPVRLKEAKQKFGITGIDVIIPSHWHQDHIGGIPVLAASEGARIWVWEGLREHVEHPENFITTCWTSTRFKADRILSEGETFEWGGYSFQVFHNPVHMEEQMGLAARVDGMKFYFTADGSASNREGYMRSSIHCYNGISIRTGLVKTARSFYEADPYICVPAHSNAFAVQPDTRQEFVAWAMAATDATVTLLPPGQSETGFDPYWASFYPAKIRLNPGEKAEVLLRIRNSSGHGISGRAMVKSHGSIRISQHVVKYEMGPGEDGEIPVGITVTSGGRPGTYILTADIETGDELFGEYPLGYIIINE